MSKLIEAIESGDVDKTLKEFISFLCGGELEAMAVYLLIGSGRYVNEPKEVQMLCALTMKIAELAVKHENRK